MCFTGNIFTRRKLAREDIVCYKDGIIRTSNKYEDSTNPRFIPIFRVDYAYKKDELQHIIKLKKYFSWFNIEINEGYHSYANKLYDANKFIIPKGTHYYTDGHCYVSETIKWVE